MKKIFSFIFFIVVTASLFGQVRLPALIRDSMVLQRDTKIKIWGWAGKSEKIKIVFNGKNFKTVTGEDGKWLVVLPFARHRSPRRSAVRRGNRHPCRSEGACR